MNASPGWAAAPFRCRHALALLCTLTLAPLLSGCKTDPTHNPFLAQAPESETGAEDSAAGMTDDEYAAPGHAYDEARDLVNRLQQRGRELQEATATATDAARSLRDEVQATAVETGADVQQTAAAMADDAQAYGRDLAQRSVADAQAAARAAGRAAQLQAIASLEDRPLEQAGPLLLVAMSQGSPEVQQAAAEQLGRRWAPAARYTVESVARGRQAAIERLRQEWIAQHGEINDAALAATAQAHQLIDGAQEQLDHAQAVVADTSRRLTEMQEAVAAIRQANLPAAARQQAAEKLAQMAADADAAVRIRAAQAMGDVADPAFMPVLMGQLDDEMDVQIAAMESLERIAGRDVTATPDGRALSTDERARSWQLWYREQQDAAGSP
ncbi:MAG: hypothetical protein DWQ37_07185 [Planctomycetota bacterium]|nr:MAG: hypothetical protein DWQ37_07185 [Planctomycetota bacterium]